MTSTVPETESPHQAMDIGRIGRTALLFMLLVAVWLLAHPYNGIWHDARLYSLQALFHLHPEVYRNDLFFFSSSQDDYTLFSPIYAAFISLLGLNEAAIALLLIGYLIWVGSAALLLRSLLNGFPLWLGLILLFAMPRVYCGDYILKYAEPFLTPRLFAEGLTLLSLAMMLKRKHLTALAALAAAFVVQPLSALAGAGFAAFYAAQHRPKAAVGAAALGLGLLFGLAFFNVPPFDRLLVTMDRQWFELSFARVPYVFWDGWKLQDWLNRVLLSFSLLASAGILSQGAHRRAFLAVLAVGAAALLFTWLGTSFFHNLLLIQIQPWRSLWLTQLFSWIAAAWLVAQFWRRDQTYRILLLVFFSASLTLASVGGILALLAAVGLIWHARAGREIGLSKTSIKLLYLFPFFVATLWVASSVIFATVVLNEKGGLFDHFISFTLNLVKELLADGGSGVIAVGLLLAVWRYGTDRRKFVHLGVFAGILSVLFLSIAIWYRPNDNEGHVERWFLQDPVPAFTRFIPGDAVVYWGDNLTMTWFALGRAHYASNSQMGGIIFSRQTAIEGKRRMDRLAALGQKDSIFEWYGNGSRLTKPSMEGLIHVCYDPALDYVILSEKFGAGVIEHYFEKTSGRHFYLYDCTCLRRDFADTWQVNNNKQQ